MFHTLKQSSERSSRRDTSHSQRGPSSQRSRCRSALSSPSRHSDDKPQWKIPLWVHCENCHIAYDINPNLSLLSCGHIFCRTCLHLDNGEPITQSSIQCVRCNTSETYISINGSLDEKLHGMFQQGWMDPVLSLDVRHIQFMMTKSQNYSKYLSKSIKQSTNLSPEWEERQNLVKKTIARIQKLKNMEKEADEKTGLLKSAAMKVYKNVQKFRTVYERAKAEYQRKQQQFQQHGRQGNQRKDMKLISSGRNEQSNQYIGQLKSSNRPVNPNKSAPEFRNYSEKVEPPPRQNQSLNLPRDSSRHTPNSNSSKRPAIPGTTFRPQTKSVNSDHRRYEQQQPQQQHQPAAKRLVPSYAYDQYTNPPKRAAYYTGQTDLNTSISSVGSSQILNPARNYNGQPMNTRRNHPY